MQFKLKIHKKVLIMEKKKSSAKKQNENHLRTKMKIICISFDTGRGNQVALFLSFLKLIKKYIFL